MTHRLIYPIGTIVFWYGNTPAIGIIKSIRETYPDGTVIYSFHEDPQSSGKYCKLHETNLRPATLSEIKFFLLDSTNPNKGWVELTEDKDFRMSNKPYSLL